MRAWSSFLHVGYAPQGMSVRPEPSKPRIHVARREQETVCGAKFPEMIGYHCRNAKPAKTEIALVHCARPLSMVLDNVGDIGEPFMWHPA